MKIIIRSLLGVAGAVATLTPAFATTAPVPVPEPTTMSIFAVSAAGAALAYRLLRR